MARGRPKKALLSRDLIVTTAVAQLDAGKDLSLSRIARELSVHVSSLYNHVNDRDGLIELMREHLATEYPVPPIDNLSWQESMRAVATTIRSAFAAHPGLVPYLAMKPVSSPSILETYDGLSSSMLAAGFSSRTVSLTIRLIDGLTLGSGLDSGRAPRQAMHADPTNDIFHQSEAEWAADSAHSTEAFQLGLELIIDGLTRELSTA